MPLGKRVSHGPFRMGNLHSGLPCSKGTGSGLHWAPLGDIAAVTAPTSSPWPSRRDTKEPRGRGEFWLVQKGANRVSSRCFFKNKYKPDFRGCKLKLGEWKGQDEGCAVIIMGAYI